MAERTKPGQIRVHRGFLKADGLRALWPEVRFPRNSQHLCECPATECPCYNEDDTKRRDSHSYYKDWHWIIVAQAVGAASGLCGAEIFWRLAHDAPFGRTTYGRLTGWYG